MDGEFDNREEELRGVVKTYSKVGKTETRGRKGHSAIQIIVRGPLWLEDKVRRGKQ